VLAQARAAELRGELAQAAALFAQGGRLDEAARVMVLRGDAETEPAARLQHYVQAVATAPEGGEAGKRARMKHAELVLSMAANGAMTPALRQDLLHAAAQLEAIAEHEKAAEAYALAGDVDGEARTLARAGEIERLDALLAAQQGRDREARGRMEAHQELAVLVASGRRREAAAVARASNDDAVKERGLGIEARRVSGDVVRLEIAGHETTLVLGDEVVVGRSATLSIASAAVSRAHVTLARRGDDVVVRDLGSRNGTLLRGLALVGEAVVGEGIEVKLGKEVPLVVRPSTDLAGAMVLEIGGARYTAPLGPARLGIGDWRVERAPDGWVELVTGDAPPAFLGPLQLATRVTLLAGDAIARERRGPPVVVVGEPCRPS
jgi:hypothetical protein